MAEEYDYKYWLGDYLLEDMTNERRALLVNDNGGDSTIDICRTEFLSD